MARPFFMPLLAPEGPGRRLRRPGRARREAPVARGRMAAQPGGGPGPRAAIPIPYLGVTTSLEGCRGSGLADAVLRRVLRCGCPVGTVVLDLGTAATLEPEACAAILALHQRLTAIGTRLRLAASTRGLVNCLADSGGGPATRPRHDYNARYEDERSMVITTNILDREALCEQITERTVSRLTEMCDELPLIGADRRMGFST